MPKTWVVAHRGASGHAPENTLAAFRRAIDLGATFIHTALQLTRDAHLVAMEDATVERTTNGKGPVRDFSLAELRQLDAGSWFAPEFAGQRVPTLEEILDFAREEDMVFYLQVKSAGTWGMEHALVNVLREARMAAHTAVLSSDPNALDNVRRRDPTLITGLLFETPLANPAEVAWQVGARQLAPRADLVTDEMVAKAHESGLQVVTWPVNDPGEMQRAISTGVDGVMTGFPDRLVTVLKNSGSAG